MFYEKRTKVVSNMKCRSRLDRAPIRAFWSDSVFLGGPIRSDPSPDPKSKPLEKCGHRNQKTNYYPS